jgi:hypothetical protein
MSFTVAMGSLKYEPVRFLPISLSLPRFP